MGGQTDWEPSSSFLEIVAVTPCCIISALPISGSGTVFKLNRDGSGYQILYDFSSGGGWWPDAALVQGSDGALYGTTYGGVVFKLNKDGSSYEILYNLGYAGELGSFHSALVE